MNKLKNKLLFVILGFFLILLINGALADTGPHTAVALYFNVTYNNSPIKEQFYANIFSCHESECESDNSAACIGSICEFNYYRIERVPSQMKLFVSINNEDFTSDVINFSWTNPVFFYNTNLDESNKAAITPLPEQNKGSDYSLLHSFILALALTIIIELAVLAVFLRRWNIKIKEWLKPVATLIIANIISVPLVWLIFFFLIAMLVTIFPWLSIILSFIIAEALAVIFEAYFIFWINKKAIDMKRAFILSIVMNIASFIIGGIILATLLNMKQQQITW